MPAGTAGVARLRAFVGRLAVANEGIGHYVLAELDPLAVALADCDHLVCRRSLRS